MSWMLDLLLYLLAPACVHIVFLLFILFYLWIIFYYVHVEEEYEEVQSQEVQRYTWKGRRSYLLSFHSNCFVIVNRSALALLIVAGAVRAVCVVVEESSLQLELHI